jgi:hypothetical protein
LTVTAPIGDLGLGGGFVTNAFPQVAINPVNNELYVVYDDIGVTPGDKGDIWFTASSPGGASWASPIFLNDDPGTNDQWQPALAVTPDGSKLGVFWYDRRLDPANRLIDRFGVIASIDTAKGDVSFGPNFLITDTSFPDMAATDPLVDTHYMGDYDTAAADNNFFYTAWGDNRDGPHQGPNVRFEQISTQTGQFFANNTLVNDPAEDAKTFVRAVQSETSILLAGPNVVVGFNDSGAFNRSGTNHFTGWSVSTDGGKSFTDEDVLPTSPSGDAGDPVLVQDNLFGTVFLATLNGAGSKTAGIQVFPSTDNGVSFGAPVNGAPGFLNTDFLDKPWMAADNFAGPGQGNLYLSFTDFPNDSSNVPLNSGAIVVTTSTDGGATWGLSGGTIVATGDVQGSFVVVGPDHSVDVFWLDSNGPAHAILMARSTDQGQTFGAPVTVATLTGTGSEGDLGLGGGFRSDSFPTAAVNPVTGDLYVVYNDVGAAPGDKGDIWFVASADGQAWSTPVVVNWDDGTTNDQWQPGMAVTPDGSKVGVFWSDRRLDPANSLIDRFGVIGVVDFMNQNTVNFTNNLRVTNTSFPAVIGTDPRIQPDYMGDYNSVAADNNFFYTAWGDNRDTLQGPNVRFARINLVGQVPGVNNDLFTMNSNAILFGPQDSVLANDIHPHREPLIAVLQRGPSHGNLVLNRDGSFTYTPQRDFRGEDTFTYVAVNRYGSSKPATVTIKVLGRPPVAADDAYRAAANGVLHVSAAAGVLANDTDAEHDPLTAVLVRGPVHGALTLNQDGSFTYTPRRDFRGQDSFTYVAEDRDGRSNPATVTITVAGHPPVAVNDAYAALPNITLSVAAARGVLANDTDAEHDRLSATLVTGPAHGVLHLSPDGAFTYTPARGFSGSDSFTYRANDLDGGSNSATVTISVKTPVVPPGRAPVAMAAIPLKGDQPGPVLVSPPLPEADAWRDQLFAQSDSAGAHAAADSDRLAADHSGSHARPAPGLDLLFAQLGAARLDDTVPDPLAGLSTDSP